MSLSDTVNSPWAKKNVCEDGHHLQTNCRNASVSRNMFDDLEIRMEWSTLACSKRSQNSLLASSRSIQVSQPIALEHWKSKMRGTTRISFLCMYRSQISRKVGTQATTAVASSRTTSHSQFAGGSWGFARTERISHYFCTMGQLWVGSTPPQETPVAPNRSWNYRHHHCSLCLLAPPPHQ